MEPELFFGTIVAIAILVVVVITIKHCENPVHLLGAVAIIATIIMVAVLPTALGESRHGTVVVVVYDEDTFIVEYDDGNRDLYDDRGDLVPGDEVFVDGDDIKLGQQSDWVWFDLAVDGEPVASFLYPEDAQMVKELVAN